MVLVAGDTILGSVGKKEERKKKCYKHTENIFEITQCVIHMSKNIVTKLWDFEYWREKGRKKKRKITNIPKTYLKLRNA